MEQIEVVIHGSTASDGSKCWWGWVPGYDAFCHPLEDGSYSLRLLDSGLRNLVKTSSAETLREGKEWIRTTLKGMQ